MEDEAMDVSTDSAVRLQVNQFQLANDILVYNKKIPIAKLIDNQNHIRRYEIKQPIGFAILLGNDRSPHEEPVRCVHDDLELMRRSLKACPGGWEIFSPCSKEGNCDVILSPAELTNIIEKLVSDPSRLNRYSSFLCYYSGHGVSRGVVLCDGTVVTYKSIVESLCIPDLQDKPKLFVFDSCRFDSDNDHYEDCEGSTEDAIEDKSGIPFYKCIDLKYQKERNEEEGYPPQNTAICFSAADGMPCWGYNGAGSIYTLQLCHALPQYCQVLSFCEIMTQLNGMTVNISKAVMYDEEKKKPRIQQPVWYSTLNKLLILNPAGLAHAAAAAISSEHAPVLTPMKPLLEGEVELDKAFEQKGQYPPKHEARAGSPVMTDRVQGRRRVFHSREEVEGHLSQLGEGVSVFVCYAPDPESPYFDPRTREGEIRKNERSISILTADLEQHGFHVISDLHLGDIEPRNWLRWYINRIRLCDHIILICSPAFNELFSRETLQNNVLDERAKMVRAYSHAIYSEITQDAATSGNTSKLIPVILDRAWEGSDSIPSLFRGGTVYNLFGATPPRNFVYANTNGYFERLVCRMAGINRVELDKPREKLLHRLPKPDEKGPAAGFESHEKFLQVMSKPRPGYTVVPSSVGQPAASQPAPSPWASWQPPRQGYQPVHSSYQPAYHPYSAAPVQKQQSATAESQPRLHTVAAQPAPPPPVSYDVTAVPDKPPRRSVILWLSKRIVKWKFVARYLGLEDYEIDRIVDENPRDLTEQCYQMFCKWEQRMPEKYSYRILGKVLLENEKNKMLFAEFAKEVNEAETVNAS